MESITVSELCERSTVRRNTFYRHFSDKYAFLEFYLQSLTERFMAEAEQESDLEGMQEYAQHMHRALIRFIESHQESTRYSMGNTALMSTIDMIVRQVAQGITLRAAQGLVLKGHKSDMPVEFLGYFYSAGLVHTLRWWFFE